MPLFFGSCECSTWSIVGRPTIFKKLREVQSLLGSQRFCPSKQSEHWSVENGDDRLGMSFKVGRSAFLILLCMWLSFVFFSFPSLHSPVFVCVCVSVYVCAVTHLCVLIWMRVFLLSFTMIDTDRDLEQPTETSDSLLVEGSGDSE